MNNVLSIVFFLCFQLVSRRAEAARGLPVVQSSLDDALRLHQEQQLSQQQAPLPPCTPAQGASHNGVALPNLHIEAEFRSRRPRHATDVTIVTQCSFDRLPMLEAQCASWGGVISASVYWPRFVSNASEHSAAAQQAALDAAKHKLAALHAQMDSTGACSLDMVIVSEHIQPELLWAYPYNALRNHAVMRAATDTILLLDVDFIVTEGLHERLAGGAAAEALAEDLSRRRTAVVLPAFETSPALSLTEGRATAQQATGGGKANLLSMFRERSVLQFADFYPAGHGPTDYKQWFQATAPYPIHYEKGYEPYLLIDRRLMPLYDERFRGYGYDKVMHVWQLHAQGFQLVGHPEAWVVHRPHAPSAGYLKAFTGPRYTAQHQGTAHMKHMERMAKEMIADVQNGTYPAAGVSALAACRQPPQQPERLIQWW